MYSENLVIKLNAIAQSYREIISQAVNAVLSQDKFRNTGAGLASLKVEVITGDASKAPQIIITFDDHILFLDKRRMQWTKQPDFKKILEWAKTKTFDKVPGYSNPRSIDNLKAAERVAYAIARDKKKNDTWKAKPWRKKSLSSVLKEMNQMIKSGFEKAIEEDLTNAIKQAA